MKNLDSNPLPPLPSSERDPPAPKSNAAKKYALRVLRDVFLLSAVVFIVNWGQSIKFKGQLIPPWLHGHTWETLDGGFSTIDKSKQMTVLFVFAPWCQVCHKNTGLFDEESPDYKVQGSALAYDETSQIKQFVEQTGFKPQVLLMDSKVDAPASEGQAIQKQSSFDEVMKINEFPTFLVLSPNGEVLTGWSGYTTSLGFRIRMGLIRFFSSHLFAE